MKDKKVSISDNMESSPAFTPNPVEDEDVFEAELLPSYAKTYILPRKMSMRRSSSSEVVEDEDGTGRSRKGSYARKQSTVSPEFQMSMLRASLEEKNIISVPEEEEDEGERPPPSRRSLVPCVGAGRMREYTDYIKEGNFAPMTVLDTELGINSEIFAKTRSRSVASTRGTSGRLSALQGEETVNLDDALKQVTEALERVEGEAKVRRESLSLTAVKPERRRLRGRRARPGHEEHPASANSETSSGYHSQGLIRNTFQDTPDPEDYDDAGANLLDALIEEKHRFTSSFSCGEATLDLFLDKRNPCNKIVHPALPKVIEEKVAENKKRGEMLRLKGTLQSLQGQRRQSLHSQEKLVGQARLFTRRATVYRAQNDLVLQTGMVEQEERTRKLTEVCDALRQEISKVHEMRIEKVERKVSVKLIEKDPSKRETHKIQAISLCYEIHFLKKRLAEIKLKTQEQIKKTENRRKEVIRLRSEISKLKVLNSNITIGLPINKIDVRQRKLSDDTASVSDTTSSTSLNNINNFGADFTFQQIAEMMAD